MEEKVNVHKFEPIVHEKRTISNKNILFALVIGILIILIEFSFVFFFELNLRDSLIIGFILILFYGIFLLFLIEPRVIREIHNLEVRTVEKPIIKEITRSIQPTQISEPMIPNEIVRTVEKPIPVYISTPRQKLDIPRYEYLGSSETKTYHTRYCRLGKLIKKKYKLHSNDKSYFKNKGFAPCKVCILKKKRI